MVGLGVPGSHCFPDTFRWKKTPKTSKKTWIQSLSFRLLSHFGCEWLHVVLAMVNRKQHGSGAFWNCSEESGTNFSCEKTVIWVETKRCPGCLDSPISVVYVLKYQRLMEGKRHKKSVQQDCPKISMGFHAYIVSSQISNLISRPHFNLKGNPPEA